MFETFEHTADIGIRGIGSNYSEAFSEAAKCVFNIMADLSVFINDLEVSFECRAFNMEELLVEFINKLLYQAAINKCIFTDFNIISLADSVIKARVSGEKLKANHKNSLKLEVKAATYHQLKVYKDNDKYIVQCIVDV